MENRIVERENAYYKSQMPTRSAPQAHEIRDLLPGEEFVGVDKSVGYMTAVTAAKVMGEVTVTTYRIRFEGNDNKRRCHFDIPLGFIWKVEKIGHSTMSRGEDSYGIDIHCKDMRHIRLVSNQQDHGRRRLTESLKFAFPLTNKKNLFAFSYADALGKNPFPGAGHFQKNGWSLFDGRRELERIITAANAKDTWVVSDINLQYQYADTYPSVIAIPKAAADLGREFLKKVGEFRSKQRIPALSWLHPVKQASITRCSQPLSGVTGKRSPEDEELLKLIRDANAHAKTLLLFDARPILNARVNKAKGGGYEEEYDDCQLTFLNIHNIHVVRESLRKLQAALFPRVDEKNYLKQLDDSKWLQHLQSICEGSVEMVYEIENNSTSILVHCTDGWDRTAQLTSLSMIQLDPFYRTIDGFAVLIEKEWCAFGHKFAQRIGHGEDKPSDGERSPIFIQFIDCVWQCLRQFPIHFEFTSRLLIFILDELFACRFGTFLFNCEKQRIHENRCNENTVSLWSHVLTRKSDFLNPLYRRKEEREVIKMNTKLPNLHVWNEYYARHNPVVISSQAETINRVGNERALSRTEVLQELVQQLEKKAKLDPNYQSRSYRLGE